MLLEAQRPDPSAIAELKRRADAPASTASMMFERAGLNDALGRVDRRIQDLRETVTLAHAQGDADLEVRALGQLAGAEGTYGSREKALQIRLQQVEAAERSQQPGKVAASLARLVKFQASSGQGAAAEQSLRRLEKMGERLEALGNSGKGRNLLKIERLTEVVAWNTELARAYFARTRGDPKGAEAAFRKLIGVDLDRNDPDTVAEDRSDLLLDLVRTLVDQGRVREAEVMIRQAVGTQLQRDSQFRPLTAEAIALLASVLNRQNRFDEAAALSDAAMNWATRAGHEETSIVILTTRVARAETLGAQNRWKEAEADYSAVSRVVGLEAKIAGLRLNKNVAYGIALLKSGKLQEGLALAQQIAALREKENAANEQIVAEGFALLGAAEVATGQREAALSHYRRALSGLIASARDPDQDDAIPAIRDRRLSALAEPYLSLIANWAEPRPDGAVADGFRLADALRGQSVQRALVEASARTSVSDPALAHLIRQEQDLKRMLQELAGKLGEGEDPATVRKALSDARAQRAALLADLRKRFPAYADLVNPAPGDMMALAPMLGAREAFVTFFLGADHSFAWAVRSDGRTQFVEIPMTDVQIDGLVTSLRRALDPQVSTLAQIPAFDINGAHRLYSALLSPLTPLLQGATSLTVAPHRELAQLPFGLLVTDKALGLDTKAKPAFAGYRSIPWLIRSYSVSHIPSAAALIALRKLPLGQANRRSFLGFGDPIFGGAVTAPPMKSRGLVRRAAPGDGGMLPPLPDTADELRNVALSLRADPERDVFLQASASRATLARMPLNDRKVVMFATHGLVPGDLDGLAEPALALSPTPDDDGLLTVSQVLNLKLDADWVVLSACNTASGNGAGAEAVSGLGRAFFYAGSRALLVTHWPVETTSARTLTTEVFRRQAENPSLDRAQALQQAQIALIDGPGAVENNKTIFSYAHPLFWASYALVGDGGISVH
ncbi:CHAT domain-containing protein [Lacibacterium aquatile]|uniref:CHAT domain-containing protein n=1 Tax=Lacibacterium aquatile TaxID=1168082 RepID=A0ABW5DPS7_9PROT